MAEGSDRAAQLAADPGWLTGLTIIVVASSLIIVTIMAPDRLAHRGEISRNFDKSGAPKKTQNRRARVLTQLVHRGRVTRTPIKRGPKVTETAV